MQSSLSNIADRGLHVAIIMDGNGRWATERGMPRTAGHKVGTEVVRDIIGVAPDHGISMLSLYAFSSDNWKRPAREVGALMKLLRYYLLKETANCVRNKIRISVIGRRDRLPLELKSSIEAAEEATREGSRLHVRAAIDYSSREAICEAAGRWAGGRIVSGQEFSALIGRAGQPNGLTVGPVPDVDLLIRTGGEQRLSDFLLWECAYAELYFTKVKWPDFKKSDLEAAVVEFHKRSRRFGGLVAAQHG